MKLRHIYKFFDEANSLVFDNALPKVRINLSKRDKGFYGMCYGRGFKGQRVQGARVMLSIPAMINYMPYGDIERSIKHILLHEMVHLYQYTTVKENFYYLVNSAYDWHDKETFYYFGHKAHNFRLIQSPELLDYEN